MQFKKDWLSSEYESCWKALYIPFLFIREGREWRIEGRGLIGFRKDTFASSWLASVGLDVARFRSRRAAYDALRPLLSDFENQQFLELPPSDDDLLLGLLWQQTHGAGHGDRSFVVTSDSIEKAWGYEVKVTRVEDDCFQLTLSARK